MFYLSAYEKYYDVTFESITTPSDILSTTELVFDIVGGVETVDGVVNNAFTLPSSGSIDYIHKPIHYECLGKLNMCYMGMTFNVWLRVNETVWSDGTVYTLVNAISSAANAQGFRVTTTGKNGVVETYLEDQQELIKQMFPVPIEKWFYFTYRLVLIVLKNNNSSR